MQIKKLPHVLTKVVKYQSYLTYEDWQEIIIFVLIQVSYICYKISQFALTHKDELKGVMASLPLPTPSTSAVA